MNSTDRDIGCLCDGSDRIATLVSEQYAGALVGVDDSRATVDCTVLASGGNPFLDVASANLTLQGGDLAALIEEVQAFSVLASQGTVEHIHHHATIDEIGQDLHPVEHGPTKATDLLNRQNVLWAHIVQCGLHTPSVRWDCCTDR